MSSNLSGRVVLHQRFLRRPRPSLLLQPLFQSGFPNERLEMGRTILRCRSQRPEVAALDRTWLTLVSATGSRVTAFLLSGLRHDRCTFSIT